MSLLFVDGFDHYATADFSKKYVATVGSPVITAGIGRRGTKGYDTQTGGGITKEFPAESSWVMGIAFKIPAAVPNPVSIPNGRIFTLLDGATQQCELRFDNATQELIVTRNGTLVTGGRSSIVLSLNQYYYIEWKVTISDSIAADSCVVRVDGVEVINVTAGQDLKNTANTTATRVLIGIGTTNAKHQYDDLYICNQSGSTNNNFLGDCRVDTLYPDADGFYTDGTPSAGSDHYAMVDETPVSTTDYVTLASLNDRDSYSFDSLPALAGQVVYGVQAVAATGKDDSGLISAATFVRSGTSPAVDQDGVSTPLPTTYTFLRDIYEQNPDTSTAWDRDSVNAAEFGVVVTA
jgi:hypothetical protein